MLVVADVEYHGRIRELLKKQVQYLTTNEIGELNAEQYQPQPTPVTLRVKRGFGEIYDLAGA
jgi:hypothetical protein